MKYVWDLNVRSVLCIRRFPGNRNKIIKVLSFFGRGYEDFEGNDREAGID